MKKMSLKIGQMLMLEAEKLCKEFLDAKVKLLKVKGKNGRFSGKF